MKIEYTSNNSGGSWWLSDDDWKNLEKAGWTIIWGGEYFCHTKFSFHEKPENKPEPCKSDKKCPGHRCFDSWEEMTNDDKWLGALAKSAYKDFNSIIEALKEFEKITGQNVSDEGCNCCGAPHGFHWTGKNGEYGYCSGEDCLEYLFPKNKTDLSKRELL